MLCGVAAERVWSFVSRPPRRATVVPPPSQKNEYRGAYAFHEDWFTSNVATWREYLAPFKDRPVEYLEVGTYEGRSVIWALENILTHPDSRATVIDVFGKDVLNAKPYKEVFLANLDIGGFRDRVTVIDGYSQVELRKLPLAHYDIIYIDGSHHADDCLEDGILSHRLLKPGGLLIFDDYELDAGPAHNQRSGIDAYLSFWGDELEVLHKGWQVIVRKR